MAEVTLTAVRRDDLDTLFRIKVAPEQRGVVAPNEITLAQAAYEAKPHAFAIRVDETIVGLAAMIDFRGDPYPNDCDDPEAAYLWRVLKRPVPWMVLKSYCPAICRLAGLESPASSA